MGKIFGIITGILVAAICLVRFLPFIPIDTKIQWITYLGLALMLVNGGTAFAVVKKALVGVVIGAVTYAIVLGFLESIPK